MHDQGMKLKKQIGGAVLLLVLIAVTFHIYMKGYTLSELQSALANADARYLMGGLGMILLFVLCEAVNIYLILKALGYRTSFFRCIEYSSLGFYFSSITPSASGGQPVQIYYMKRDKLPLTVSSVTIFFIVYVYQIAMLLVAAAAALLRLPAASYFAGKLYYLLVYGVIVNTGAIFIFFSLMFSKKFVPGLLRLGLRLGMKFRLIKRTDDLRNKLDHNLASYQEKAMVLKRHPLLFVKILVISILQMISFNSIPALVYCSMGYDIKQLPDLLTCQSLLTVSVSGIPLPGAEGVSQGGFLQVFDVYFPSDTLTYAMLIHRVISFYLPVLLSFAMYILTHIRTSKRSVRGD